MDLCCQPDTECKSRTPWTLLPIFIMFSSTSSHAFRLWASRTIFNQGHDRVIQPNWRHHLQYSPPPQTHYWEQPTGVAQDSCDFPRVYFSWPAVTCYKQFGSSNRYIIVHAVDVLTCTAGNQLTFPNKYMYRRANLIMLIKVDHKK